MNFKGDFLASLLLVRQSGRTGGIGYPVSAAQDNISMLYIVASIVVVGA